MITFTSGNMFETPADIRINTVNCVGVMGAGLALAFKTKYPEMFREYQKACKMGAVRPGKLHVWKTLMGDWIINFPTKRHWREPSRYEDIEAGLIALRKYLSEQGKVKVLLPAVGCGHGGLEWPRISEMIKKHLNDLESDIIVFTPEDSRAAGNKIQEQNDSLLQDKLDAEGIKTIEPGNDFFPKSLQGRTAAKLYIKGDPQKLNSPLLTILPSMKPASQEINAAVTVSNLIMKPGITLLIGYSAAIERPLIKRALEKGADVVIFLAEGILDFRVRKDLLDVWDENRITIVSAAKPNERWNPAVAFRAKDLQLSLASAAIITDAEPQSLSKILLQKATQKLPQIYYINYGKTYPNIINTFNTIKAKSLDVNDLSNPLRYKDILDLFGQKETSKPTSERNTDEINPPIAESYMTAVSEVQRIGELGIQATESTAYPKRLIEVDLPIKRISEHARREKSIRHGHISTLHIWWARRPLAACRAVICAALWPDPADSLCPEKFKNTARQLMMKWAGQHLGLLTSSESIKRFVQIQKKPDLLNDNLFLRQALLDFIADFANWDNSTIREYLETSRKLTHHAHQALDGTAEARPLVVDPFAGGGSIPFEALRVGADVFASDYNPIPVILNKVVLEYLPKYGQKLAGDIRKWGDWVKKRAEKELAQYYPKDNDGATPIAYLWARTIQCEGPGCGAEVPLIGRTVIAHRDNGNIALVLKSKKNSKAINIELVEDQTGKKSKGTSKGFVATCPRQECGYSTPKKSVQSQLTTQNGGADTARLIAVLTSGSQGRHYRTANISDTEAFAAAQAKLKCCMEKSEISIIPDEPIPSKNMHRAVGSQLPLYGFKSWGDLFNSRQKLAISVLQKITRKVYSEIAKYGDKLYAQAVFLLLAFAIDKQADYSSSLCRWVSNGEFIAGTLAGEKKLPMIADFAESNPVGNGSGCWDNHIDWIARFIERECSTSSLLGTTCQSSADEKILPSDSAAAIITDPPYYDSVPYSNLSDYFYVWLKRTVHGIIELSHDGLTPKEHEMTVNHPDDQAEKLRYESLLTGAFNNCRNIIAPKGIGVIVFAHKSTSGWETLIEAIIKSGWIVTASWPIDTERTVRLNALSTASLVSSIHIICRPREIGNCVGDWRDVIQELPNRIHEWMPRLAHENVVGADAIFACLGPALEIFSRYSRVEKASGEQVTLKEYLEQVWAVVAKEALTMIFEGADTSGFEEDARLTAIWLWTLNAGAISGDTSASGDDEDDDDEKKSAKTKLSGYMLEYDAARKIAQGLGAHLERLQSLVEVKGDKVRLLPVAERTKFLFGKEDSETPAQRRKKKSAQLELDFMEEIEKVEQEGSWGQKSVPQIGNTRLDRVHQSMILFAAGRGEALKRFLVEEGIGRDQKFWRLAQSLSALYPANSDEKRWVDGVLARKKGLGF